MDKQKIEIGSIVRHCHLSGRHQFCVANMNDEKVLVRYVVQGGKIETLDLFLHEVELFIDEDYLQMERIGV
ncbi:hypothetical protein ACFOG5_01745 [Pedobacter fastidiosus]|uniref:DUF1653 domain-containing protein n=1 Tax=Pedobacter fastidiosus TaxID=2765361 RepID=A0ABR7KRX4_9SPHI|nr:hypothetical protein [Pedobacter fastidiosus]MBC6110839.1 hypothetical protein [Pedobacter fastidiosus]